MGKKVFTILNVDDSEEYLSTHSHILKKEGYVVFEAVNGNDCFQMVKECKPDLILLDVVLPDVNGIEICRRIKNDPATKHILVLLISAFEVEKSAQIHGLDSGADGYLLKPISKQALLAHVRVMERIKRNEDELREAAAMLEQHVKERTEKLNQINEKLENEVTERKQMEKALKESENKYRLIAEKTTDVIWLMNFKGESTYVSPSIEKFAGYTVEEYLNQSIDDRFTPEAAQIVKNRLSKELGQLDINSNQLKDYSLKIELEYKCKDGTTKWGELLITPYFDNQEKLSGIHGVTRDITERKQAEHALHESENKYRDMVEQINDVMYSTDTNGIITYISPTVEILGGYKPEEMVGHSMSEFLDPIFLPKINEQFHKILAGDLSSMEYRVKIKSGEYKWVRSSSRSILKKNTLIGMRGVLTDINERKQSDILLMQSEARYRLLADHMKDTVWLMDMNLKTTYISPSVEKLRGFTLKEIHDLPLDRQFTPASFQVAMSAFSEEMPKVTTDPTYNILRTLELEFYRKDGTTYWSENKFSLIRDENGIPVSIMGEGRDITDRKRAEKALQESELRFRSLYENTSIGLYRTTPDGTILLANPTLVKMLGYTSFEKLAERNLEKEGFEPSYQRKDFIETIERDGEVNGYVSKWIIRDDKYIFVLESARAIRDSDGKTLYYDGTVEDITQRKLLEEQMRQLQKLEGLGTLAGGIAHDFNNILGIILAFNTSIKRFKNDAKKLDVATDTIGKAVERGKTLVQQILTFARKTESSFGVVNVNDVVKEIMIMVLETFPKVLNFAQNCDKNISYINADRSQLHQVLLNLCVNARDAMPKGGSLAINTRMASVASLRHQHPDVSASSYVCIEVSDTGEGMTPEVQKRIFEPFFTTKGVGKGTGLGLAVVFGVVQAHKGFIDVKSELGLGTTFQLYLPVSQTVAPIRETEDKTLEEIPGGTETLLVVEDEEMLMISLQMVLVEKGYKILSAKDGLAAMKIYQENKNDIALVLTDLGLPTISGLDMCRQIKKINPDERIIVATGYLDPDMKSELLKVRVQHFLYKPYDLTNVAKTIRNVLDKK